MKKSDTIKEIAGALQQFKIKVENIKRDATNPYHESRYATLSNILDAISVPLEEAGLVFSQFPSGDDSLTTLLIHVESGEYFESSYNMRPTKNNPQALGSAITYARRYAISSILSLNVEDDDDGNSASEKPTAPAKKKAAPKPKQADRWLNKDSPDWSNAVKKLQSGEIKIEDIKKHYKIRKDYEEELINLINTPA